MHYHWDKAFRFPEKIHFLIKTITDSVRLGVVYLNLVLSTLNGVIFCQIYPQYAAHNDITTIHNLSKIYFISSFFFNRSWIPDSRPPILDASFPVNLEVLFVKIVLFFDYTLFFL